MFIDLENLWIISDTHFNHKNIEKYEPVRLKIAKEHGYDDSFSYMMDKWNEKIKPTDEVLHLGDFAWWKSSISELTARLNGSKALIKGNHDRVTYRFPEAGWNLLDYCLIRVNESENMVVDGIKMGCYVADICGLRLLFSHRPLVIREEEEGTWTALMIREIYQEVFLKYNCDYNIHGHTHSRDIEGDIYINVSVEKTNLEPIRLRELLEERKRNKEKSA